MNRLTQFLKPALGLAAAAIVLLGAQVFAANPVIETAKSQCIIGEQTNGYLGAVDGKTLTTEQDREMRSINQKRKAVYAKLATQNGVTVEVTAQLTAEKLISQAQPGECVQTAEGDWVKR